MQIVEFQNKDGKISLNEEVSKNSMDRLLQEIEGLFGMSMVGQKYGPQNIVCSAEKAVDTLTIEINSRGGSVSEGVRLFAAIKELQNRGVKVIANVVGMAGSMASVIAMAADEVTMARGSEIMIHDASAAVMGNAAELRRVADRLDNMSAEIAGFYSEKTGLPVDEVRSLMKEETWMGVDQALALGFIDRITGEESTQPTNKIMGLLDKLKPDDALVAKVEATEKELTEVQAELDEAKTLITNAAEEMAGKDNQIAELTKQLEAKTTEATDLTAKVEETEKEVENKAEEVKKAEESAGKKASEMLAEAAHPQIKSDVGTKEEKTSFDLYAEYREIQSKDPVAAKAFWDKHSEKITGKA